MGETPPHRCFPSVARAAKQVCSGTHGPPPHQGRAVAYTGGVMKALTGPDNVTAQNGSDVHRFI